MRWLLSFSSGIDSLNRWLARGVAWLTLLMVLVAAFNAIARRVDPELSSNAYLELQWYLFSLVFLLGAPYALRRGAHVRVDVLYGGHTRRGKAWIDAVGGILFLLPFCVFAIWVSWDFVADSVRHWERSSDPHGLPRWPLKPVVPLAFALLLLQGFSEVVKRIAILRGATDAEVGLDEPPLLGDREVV